MSATSTAGANERSDAVRMHSPAGVADAKRWDIQGLRMLAVTLVVIFHLAPSLLSGGYIGVDVFFVISGFLITGHLLREIAVKGRIGILDF